MKIFKNFTILLIAISSISNAFATPKEEYQEHIEKARKYESQNKWCHALGSYYDAIISDELPENKQEAVEEFNELANSIQSGNPGLGKFNPFSIHDEWKNLLIDAEKYGSSFNPVLS